MVVIFSTRSDGLDMIWMTRGKGSCASMMHQWSSFIQEQSGLGSRGHCSNIKLSRERREHGCGPEVVLLE